MTLRGLCSIHVWELHYLAWKKHHQKLRLLLFEYLIAQNVAFGRSLETLTFSISCRSTTTVQLRTATPKSRPTAYLNPVQRCGPVNNLLISRWLSRWLLLNISLMTWQLVSNVKGTAPSMIANKTHRWKHNRHMETNYQNRHGNMMTNNLGKSGNKQILFLKFDPLSLKGLRLNMIRANIFGKDESDNQFLSEDMSVFYTDYMLVFYMCIFVDIYIYIGS